MSAKQTMEGVIIFAIIPWEIITVPVEQDTVWAAIDTLVKVIVL